MQRRNFIQNTVLSAVAVSASGFIRFNGERFEGDCETTTDILGPFYRPNAPVRSDMRIKNAPGQLIMLSGQVKHKDCTTPLKNACVEIWHCDAEGVYDNESPEFLYRAKAFCDDQGNYSFRTILPIPYQVGSGRYRPAHYHMMISAPGYQSLITQLYFAGDKHLSKDSSSSSPAAKRRILAIKDTGKTEKLVVFNVTMMEKLPAEVAVIQRLSGTYTPADKKGRNEELYVKNDLLWTKNSESINGGYPLQYNGNNTFEYYGRSSVSYRFEPQTDGSVKLLYDETSPDGKKTSWQGIKESTKDEGRSTK